LVQVLRADGRQAAGAQTFGRVGSAADIELINRLRHFTWGEAMHCVQKKSVGEKLRAAS
jgi:hypothetical protein